MTTPVDKRNASKLCEFHREVGHTTDECMHLKRQIEEMLKAGKLSHLIKELKQNNGKDQTKAAKKGETLAKDRSLAILMVQSWQRIARQRITQRQNEIGVNAGINLQLLVKVNAARHTLTTAVESKNYEWGSTITSLVDGKKVIVTEASVRRDHQLDNESMVKNLNNVGKFLMYPRFVQVFLDNQLEEMETHNRTYIAPSHTKKIFANMRRQGKDFSGRVTPLFPTMVVQAQEEMGEGLAMPTDPHHTPIITQPSSSQPQRKQKSRRPKRKDTEIPQSSGPTNNVADEAVNEEMDDSLERAVTTATSLDAEQDRGNISKTQSKATPNEPSSLRTSSGGGP
ncbi:hypothetical protein Tco_0809872, partial [Tanacetum coccineum]